VQITIDDRTSISDHPPDILTTVRDYFEKWHGPKQSKGIPKGSLWEQIYQPAEYLEVEWYEHLLDVPRDAEIERAVRAAPSGKAAGASKVTKELLTHMEEKATRLFYGIVKACKRQTKNNQIGK